MWSFTYSYHSNFFMCLTCTKWIFNHLNERENELNNMNTDKLKSIELTNKARKKKEKEIHNIHFRTSFFSPQYAYI